MSGSTGSEFLLMVFLGACIVAIVLLILKIINALTAGRGIVGDENDTITGDDEQASETGETEIDSAKPSKNLTPKQEMVEREKTLHEREEKMKAEKIQQLKEREEKISKKPSNQGEKKDSGFTNRIFEDPQDEISDGDTFSESASSGVLDESTKDLFAKTFEEVPDEAVTQQSTELPIESEAQKAVESGDWFMKSAPKTRGDDEVKQINSLLERLEKQHDEGIITTEHYETIKADYERQLEELKK